MAMSFRGICVRYFYGVSWGALAFALAACSTQHHGAAPANGRTIFQTGQDSRGKAISASPRPLYSSCGACHGATGAGGVRLPGGAVSADLRHAALVTRQKHPYTTALLERAIARGIDNEGQRLNAVMPRWRMNARDLRDVARYVKTLK